MKVVVGQEHILAGTPKDSMSCPIALALQAQYPTRYGEWCVDGYSADGGNLGEYRLPLSAAEFVTKFDQGVDVYPIEFEMDLIEYDELEFPTDEEPH